MFELANATDETPSSDDYIFELKFDPCVCEVVVK